MGTKLFLCILAIGGCACFLGCGQKSRPAVPRDAITKQIGKWQTSRLPSGDSSYETLEYETSSNDTVKRIKVTLNMHGNAEESGKAFRENTACSRKRETPRALEVLKNQSVKDKSGRIIGEIQICKQQWSYSSLSEGFGEDSYSILLSNHNLIETFDTDYAGIKTLGDGKKTVSFNDLIEFVKGVPHNAQVDFSDLNLEALISFKWPNSLTAQELSSLEAPLKIPQRPYLNGKVVVFRSGTPALEMSSSFGIAENIKAKTADEAQTVVQIKCEKGRKIGDYTTYGGEGNRIPGYGKTCKVTVIDRTIPATIAQKTFMNNEIDVVQYGTPSDLVADDPDDEIKKWLAGLARR